MLFLFLAVPLLVYVTAALTVPRDTVKSPVLGFSLRSSL